MNQHNLVYEMIARGDLVLTDPEKLILPIGNLGARVTLYYLNLDKWLHFKRQNDHSEKKHRIVRLLELSRTLEAVPTRQPAQLQAWHKVLEKLRRFFIFQDNLKVKLTYVFQREDVAQRGELTARQYIGATAHSYKQIKHLLSQLDRNLLIWIAFGNKFPFSSPLSLFIFLHGRICLILWGEAF